MGSKAEGGLGFYSTSSTSVEESVDVAREWRNAQAISLTVAPDIVTAAKRHLEFLAEVSTVPDLLQAGPALDYAIQRYEHCWLPLLASQACAAAAASPLVPPLDCAWVWHCHRLNPTRMLFHESKSVMRPHVAVCIVSHGPKLPPQTFCTQVQYVEDCERLYGRLLGAHYFEQNATIVEATKTLWRKHYPEEDYSRQITQPPADTQFAKRDKSIEYDLVAAVVRQNSFYYQVSQPYVKEESYLHSAEQRYKGFLYLFAKSRTTKTFLVPTYDIDLMWHTHQLDPAAYNRDLLLLAGRLLHHDDTDDNREAGGKLRTGFQDTKRLWEESFGSMYEKAGAMYRGPAPSFVAPSSDLQKNDAVLGSFAYLKLRDDQHQYLVERESVQLCVNILGVRNLHPHKSSTHVFVTLKGIRNGGDFHLSTPEVDMVTSPRWQQSPWMMRCTTSMEGVVFELRSHETKGLFHNLTGSKLLGEVRISFASLLASPALAIQGWYAVCQKSGGDRVYDTDHKPPALLLAASITPPVPAPYLLRAVNGDVQSDIFDGVKESERAWHVGRWLTRVVLDQNSEEVYLVRVRKMKGHMRDCIPVDEHEKQIQVCQRDLNKMKTKAWSLKSVEFESAAVQIMSTPAQKEKANVREWRLLDRNTTLTVRKSPDDPHWDDHPELELHGDVGYPVKLLTGRRLQYQVHGAKPEDESGFVTLIRYTPNCPSGIATALFNWKAAVMEVSVEENVMLVILLSTITATVVDDLLGSPHKKIVKATKRRQFPGHAQWGAVIMDRRLDTDDNRASRMIYHDWWLDPTAWAHEMYETESGGYQGGSSCGGGGCGGAVCAGG